MKLVVGLPGGTLGHLIDRIIQGYVTDFISVSTFAVFNIADSGITVGTGVLVLGIYLLERKQKREQLAEIESHVSALENNISKVGFILSDTLLRFEVPAGATTTSINTWSPACRTFPARGCRGWS